MIHMEYYLIVSAIMFFAGIYGFRSGAGLHVDRKLRRKIQEKKIALGHKPDDHEEEQNQGGMVMGGM